jgi:methylenetetrahydrofolate reductase (NADPH)
VNHTERRLNVKSIPLSDIFTKFSLEMTAKDLSGLEEAAAIIPRGTQINVTFLGNEDLEMRVTASRTVRELGFDPVPHISARRLKSEGQLEEFLGRLQQVDSADHIFVVGGDPHTSAGPFEDSLAVIQTGLLQKYGVREVSISGYPEGHSHIRDDVLWRSLEEKYAAIKEQGLKGTIITQFGFDTTPVVDWISAVRERHVDFPIRVGVPGPAGVKRLLGYARRFGVASTAGIAQKYGFSLTNLLGTAGPDKFVTDLQGHLQDQDLGTVQLHFYTFGGLKATTEWINGYERKNG